MLDSKFLLMPWVHDDFKKRQLADQMDESMLEKHGCPCSLDEVPMFLHGFPNRG